MWKFLLWDGNGEHDGVLTVFALQISKKRHSVDLGQGKSARIRYHRRMKPPPDTPEFAKFTEALKTMLKVSKVEMQKRIEEDKRTRTAKQQAK